MENLKDEIVLVEDKKGLKEYDPIQELRELNEYDSSIPRKIIHSSDAVPPPKMKVRKQWFGLVIGNLEIAILNKQITDQSLIDEANKLVKKFTSEEFRHRNTKEEDIEVASKLITRITRDL